LVGAPVELQLDAARYRGDIEFLAPRAAPRAPVIIKKTATKTDPDSPLLGFSLGRDPAQGGRNGETDHSGIYEARAVTVDGEVEPRGYALNVAAHEGDLALLTPSLLVEKLQPVSVQLHDAEQLDYESAAPSGFPWSQILALALVALLLGEQALAYSAGYHTRPGGAA
jgi:hypothetical protein